MTSEILAQKAHELKHVRASSACVVERPDIPVDKQNRVGQ